MSNIIVPGQPPEQLTYPQATMRFLPDGSDVILVVQLGPSTSINHLFDAASMDGICKQWREIKQQNEMAMRVARNAIETKL